MVLSETLRRFSVLDNLEPAFLEELTSICREKAVEKGEWLFHEGDSADALYLITRGHVDLKLKLDEKRNIDVTVTTLHEGDVLGWSAIVKPYVYSMGASATENTQLLRFNAENLRVLLELRPEQGYILMQSIAQTMATRVNVLSDSVPGITWRYVFSTLMLVLGVVTGLLVLVLGVPTLLSAVNGNVLATQAIPVAMFCLLFPVVFLILARQLSERREQQPAD